MSSRAQLVFDDFSEAVVDFNRQANRTTLKTTLFDALRRTEVTLPAYSAIVPGFLRRIETMVPAEQLGRATRALASRPNLMHIGGIVWQCLLDRERRSVLGLPAQSDRDLAWTLDYVGRVLAAARSDDSFFPCSRTGWHMRILDAASVSGFAARAESLPSDSAARLRRMSASLELYSFMLHGEHRDGIFDHGPYRLGDGRVAMFKDFTDLQSEFLPWATPELRLAHPAVSVLLVLDETHAPRVNWAGTMESAGELHEHVQAAAVFAVSGAHIESLPFDAWDPLERAARAAQKRMFAIAAGWAEQDKVKYGRWLFTNHLQEIPKRLQLGPEITRDMLRAFHVQVDEEYARLDLSTPSPLWAALRRAQPFTPLGDTNVG